jgi:hypothetical protein
MRAETLKRAGRIVAGTLPALTFALAARMSLPALAALVFVTVLVLGTTSWVIGSDARSQRAARIIIARRDDTGRFEDESAATSSAAQCQGLHIEEAASAVDIPPERQPGMKAVVDG